MASLISKDPFDQDYLKVVHLWSPDTGFLANVFTKTWRPWESLWDTAQHWAKIIHSFSSSYGRGTAAPIYNIIALMVSQLVCKYGFQENS